MGVIRLTGAHAGGPVGGSVCLSFDLSAHAAALTTDESSRVSLVLTGLHGDSRTGRPAWLAGFDSETL